jgi:hypothetical protein
MECDQKVIIRFLYKDGVSAERIHPWLEIQFREDTCTSPTVRRWCQYVQHRYEDVHDEVRFGRLPVEFLDIRIMALLDDQPFD